MKFSLRRDAPMMPDGGYSRPSAKAGGRFVFWHQPHGMHFTAVLYCADALIRAAVMIQNEIPGDHLWLSIRREAVKLPVIRDPLFGASLSSAILDHSDLGGAVAHQIGERLGKRVADREQFARVAREAFHAAPDLIEAASLDLQSIVVHDPATRELLPPLLNFKGYVALQAWRVSNWLWRERPHRFRLVAAKPFVRLPAGQHPSFRLDRDMRCFSITRPASSSVHSL